MHGVSAPEGRCRCGTKSHGFDRIGDLHHSGTDINIDPMLIECRAIVYDAGPTLRQHWINVYLFSVGVLSGRLLT